MSVSRSFAQPITRNFVITQGPDSTGVYYFTQSDIDAWYSDNTSDVNKVTPSLYIVTGNFYDTMMNLDNAGEVDGRKTLLDGGKEIIFGNTANSRLLVLRRVQFFGTAPNAGDGFEAYVVVENNTDELAPGDWGRYTVRVARI